MSDFTHFNDQGRAKMVNVGEKPITQRVAVAAGRVLVNEHTFSLIRSGGHPAYEGALELWPTDGGFYLVNGGKAHPGPDPHVPYCPGRGDRFGAASG